MKNIVYIFSILLLVSFTNRGTAKSTSVIITPKSKLVVKGKTNINTFDCVFNVTNLKKPIPVFFEIEDHKMVFKKTELVLNNACFDCGNKGMNKDFQDLLKSKKYPEIFLKLKEIEKIDKENAFLNATIEIEIAGVVKQYQTPVILDNKNELFVKGLLTLNICDFNIEPPKKLLGLICVNETIEIDFQLLIKKC
ncbi:YceI family protein [Thalassobellus citreus]|uniref:YceI family protein n=1 Tax=Thalassobellus citreus TaxID=3367752 RepID=UPI0037B32C38